MSLRIVATFVIALFAVALAAPSINLAPTAAADVPRTCLESQGWWSKDGIVVPTKIGAHIHLSACVPSDGVPINGIVPVDVTVTLHNQIGAVNFVRVSDGSTVKQVLYVSFGPCADCHETYHFDVDFTKWGTGRREMRWTANIASNAEGNRQFQSTGWQVCVRSCSPSYRTGPWIEARGWYTGRGYQNARLTSPLPIGSTINVALKPGSGGLATKFSGVYIDPHFHTGDAGIVVQTRNGQFTGKVTLPTLPCGDHRLVLLASDGKNVGVQVIPFTIPCP